MLDLAFDLASALQTNYPEFPDSCLATQFALLEDVQQVLVDRPHILLEQLGNERLRQPDRFILKAALNARPAILCLVKNDARLWRWFVWHGELGLKLTGEGLVEEGLLQCRKHGELTLKDAGEALGFFAEVVELADNLLLSGE